MDLGNPNKAKLATKSILEAMLQNQTKRGSQMKSEVE